eukprot:6182364-Pleurochrysis_carterae.AAC.3
MQAWNALSGFVAPTSSSSQQRFNRSLICRLRAIQQLRLVFRQNSSLNNAVFSLQCSYSTCSPGNQIMTINVSSSMARNFRGNQGREGDTCLSTHAELPAIVRASDASSLHVGTPDNVDGCIQRCRWCGRVAKQKWISKPQCKVFWCTTCEKIVATRSRSFGQQ